MAIQLATTDSEIESCFPVMVQLRPDLEPGTFVSRVRRQQQSGYELAMAVDDGRVVAVAGFRIGENLAWGKFLYVDDLVTDASVRSHGHGLHLMEWLRDRAMESRCDELHLDSGVQRFGAHRFYLKFEMDITSHHFRLRLDGPGKAKS